MDSKICKSIPRDIIEKKKRIIVIGDIHADFLKTFLIFKNLKLVDNNKRWIAEPKDTVIVQVGDQLDGGGRFSSEASGEQNILDFMEHIHDQALEYGGGVYSLIGNHELMNVMGDFRYASHKDIMNTGGIEKRKNLYRPGGVLAKRLSCTRNVVIKVGSFLFAHAGVLPEMIGNKDKNDMIKYLNSLMRKYLQADKNLDDKDIEKYFMASNSILWNRTYGNDETGESCDKLDMVLDYFSVDGMIIGHTPQNNITSKCNNKLWKVDVGISDCFKTKSKLQVLEIVNDGEKFNVLDI